MSDELQDPSGPCLHGGWRKGDEGQAVHKWEQPTPDHGRAGRDGGRLTLPDTGDCAAEGAIAHGIRADLIGQRQVALAVSDTGQ